MKKILLSFFIATSLINPLYSKNLTNRDCNEIASELNSTMAFMAIDKITIFENVVCLPDANLTYNYKITEDISPSEFLKFIPSLKSNNINSWCSNPGLSELIKVLDTVGFIYKNNNGIYLGEYKLDKSYCY